ncbi:hypothetical protein [Streptomyces albogriseolus]
MATESNPSGHCARCERRLSIRQAMVDWAPVITVMVEVLKSFWF